MNEIMQSVLNDDYVTFKEKFKEKLKTKYDIGVEEIKIETGKTIFETVINDGSKVIKCKNCGSVLTPGNPLMGSCPFCGDLIV